MKIRNKGQEQERGAKQGKKMGGGSAKKRAYRNRYYDSVYAGRRLKRILRSNGPAVAAVWAVERSAYGGRLTLHRLSRSEGPSEYSDATKTGRLATLALRQRSG